jgi:hypothetical protein
VGDFNRDRKLDVVVSSISSGLFLLLGKGDGSFQSPVAISGSTPDAIHFVLAADFNHDGNLDLVEEGVVGAIFVTLGKVDATFREPMISLQGGATTATALGSADINGDGALDLLVTDQNLNTVEILLGNDAGTVVKMRNVGLAPYDPDAAVAADFNGDGKLDLAVAETHSPHGQVSVELGRGHGTFGKPIVSPLIDEGINNQDLVRTGDFNGDGKADLVIMDDYAAGFEVLLGKGDGTFQVPIDTTVVSNSMTFEVGDFNGDGKADLVVTTTTGINTSLNIYL